jgi:hypothetical protein
MSEAGGFAFHANTHENESKKCFVRMDSESRMAVRLNFWFHSSNSFSYVINDITCLPVM